MDGNGEIWVIEYIYRADFLNKINKHIPYAPKSYTYIYKHIHYI